ncbi:hypothetical protein FLJC2902T_20430 [Flavobacterium limnosediminis JC2902]|uniref:Uncharacterized protein n=1 Tax=Flavobacterium limnosediminis JC2902 TaxID=1341181 RepID=V6SLN3_9FLAO|nr:hypothetical protein FLJC2902T_20430 [Flavobacterium limnosediminis JC2902]
MWSLAEQKIERTAGTGIAKNTRTLPLLNKIKTIKKTGPILSPVLFLN